MNFLQALRLVEKDMIIKRRAWADGVQASKNKEGTRIIAYHVAACEVPIRIEDMLATDWVEIPTE